MISEKRATYLRSLALHNAEIDRQVAELVVDPKMKIAEMGLKLNVHVQTIFRSLRRLGLNRQAGRPRKQVS